MKQAGAQPRFMKTKTINWCLSCSPDGTQVASGGADKTIQIWELESESCIGVLKGHLSDVYTVDYAPSGEQIVSGSSDKTVRIWDTYTFKQTRILYGHSNWVSAVQYSPDGEFIASAGFDMIIKLWKSFGQFVGDLKGHTQPVCSIKFRSDSSQLISAGFDQVIRKWNVNTQKQVGLISQNGGCITSICYSTDDSIIASGAQDLYLWNAQTQSLVNKIPMNDKINSVTYSNDGRQLILSANSKIKVFEVDSLQSIYEFDYHQERVRSVQVIKDTQNIISCCVGKQMVLQKDIPFLKLNEISDDTQKVQCNWNTITHERPLVIQVGSQIMSIALSPDGNYIASASGDNYEFQIRIWDPVTGKQVGNNMNMDSIQMRVGRILQISYSKNGNYIVSCFNGGFIMQWNVQTQQQFGKIMTGHGDCVWGVCYSPNQKYIISCSKDYTIKVWNAKTGKEYVDKELYHGKQIRCLSVSPVGNHVVYGDQVGIITIYDYEKKLQSGKSLQGHSNEIISIQYSMDGKLIVSGSTDTKIFVWDAISRQQITSYLGHTSDVISLGFSPNMRSIISGGYDSTVRVWDRMTGKQIGAPLTHHKTAVWSAQFSRDGNYIVTGGEDEQIVVIACSIEMAQE